MSVQNWVKFYVCKTSEYKRSQRWIHIINAIYSPQAIRRTIDKKTVDVYTMFMEELNAVKKELTQKSVPLPANHPKYAGQAHWARQLKKRIERSMMVRLC